MSKGMIQHPRPQMARDSIQMLDGEWFLNGCPIRVPFPPESEASGFEGRCKPKLHYCKEFVPDPSLIDMSASGRVLLHFGAVDQRAVVWLNGKPIGSHQGGYLPFILDVTDVIKPGKNYLEVFAKDTYSGTYPFGKQSKKPGGMWYTGVSGIWQSVWLESVPSIYIRELKLTPDERGIHICILVNEICQNSSFMARLVPDENGEGITTQWQHFTGTEGYLDIQEAYLGVDCELPVREWTPETPYLYHLEVRYGLDLVKSYSAIRKIEIRAENGLPGVFLNGRRIFLNGVLDQGYFPEGIYVPADPRAYELDILRMKKLGINMLRKHVKIEPEQFYYDCDRLGMLVMQDMVNSGKFHYWREAFFPTLGFQKRKDRPARPGDRKRRELFERCMYQTIRHLYNHPCVIGYTIFNEGWGQFDTDRLYDGAKSADPTRLYDAASGWFFQHKNDFDSRHVYFRNKKLRPAKDAAGVRPLFLSECGGYGLLTEEHAEKGKTKHYGYGTCKDRKELTARIVRMYEKMVLPAIKYGLCGVVYTQLSDVEEERNGLFTYDRKVCKVIPSVMRKLARQVEEELN